MTPEIIAEWVSVVKDAGTDVILVLFLLGLLTDHFVIGKRSTCLLYTSPSPRDS